MNQNWAISGAVSADGSVRGMHGSQAFSGKIEAGTLQATYPSSAVRCGERSLQLTRDAQR